MSQVRLTPRMRQVWSEARVGLGAMNFITGMGGFLQGILFGYGGLRLTLADLSVQRSALPLDATFMAFRGKTHPEMQLLCLFFSIGKVLVKEDVTAKPRAKHVQYLLEIMVKGNSFFLFNPIV